MGVIRWNIFVFPRLPEQLEECRPSSSLETPSPTSADDKMNHTTTTAIVVRTEICTQSDVKNCCDPNPNPNLSHDKIQRSSCQTGIHGSEKEMIIEARAGALEGYAERNVKTYWVQTLQSHFFRSFHSLFPDERPPLMEVMDHNLAKQPHLAVEDDISARPARKLAVVSRRRRVDPRRGAMEGAAASACKHYDTAPKSPEQPPDESCDPHKSLSSSTPSAIYQSRSMC